MIYLVPEFVSTLQDDTFWMWFHREFESTFDPPPDRIGPDDWVLQYAMLGAPACKGGRSVALLWELYPEMRRVGLHAPVDDEKIRRMHEAYEAADLSLVSSPCMLEWFPRAEVLPIGVDTDLFKPDGGERSGSIWCGTDHPMKGLDIAQAWQDHIWSTRIPVTYVMKGDLPQTELAALMRRHEYVLLAGRLRPFFLVEIEAMASGCRPLAVSGVPRDYDVTEIAKDPRKWVMESGWSRHAVKKAWEGILAG